MACACKSKNRTTYKVVNSRGRVLYSTSNKASAEGMARRYDGATVQEVPPQQGTAAREPVTTRITPPKTPTPPAKQTPTSSSNPARAPRAAAPPKRTR